MTCAVVTPRRVKKPEGLRVFWRPCGVPRRLSADPLDVRHSAAARAVGWRNASKGRQSAVPRIPGRECAKQTQEDNDACTEDRRIVVGVAGRPVVLAVIAVVLLVDPNDYKDDISSLVQQKKASVQSGVSAQSELFPWIALEIRR